MKGSGQSGVNCPGSTGGEEDLITSKGNLNGLLHPSLLARKVKSRMAQSLFSLHVLVTIVG